MNQRVVCAANRIGGKIYLGVRHYDEQMYSSMQIDNVQLFVDAGYKMEQGFVDNKCNFLSRTEAWKVAEHEGQIIRRVGGDDADGGTLYSENLY